MEPKKYEYIDSLRGIAILMVIYSHVALLSPSSGMIPYGLYFFLEKGIHGVQLFFMVSAFTLTISYYNRKGEKHELRNFFIRRFFRIAPMFYLAILFFTYTVFLKFNFSDSNLSDIPPKGIISSFLFVNGLFPSWINSYVPGGWSITVEFMFYCLLPLFLKMVKNLNNSLLLVYVTLIGSSILNLMLADSSFDKYDFLYYYLPSQLPVFALGILAYYVIKEGTNSIRPINILILAGVVFLYCFSFSLPFYLLYSIIFFLLLIVLSKKPYKVLSNKVLAFVGKCSFSMYLVHFAILAIMAHFDISFIVTATNTYMAFLDLLLLFLFLSISSFLISYFTYRFIEVPGQNIGRKLIKKLNTSNQ